MGATVGQLERMVAERRRSLWIAERLLADAVGNAEIEAIEAFVRRWLARTNIAALVAEIHDLRARLDESQLYGIKATNPGIDMDEVRALRAAGRA